jgi:hypothetical protein
MAPERIAPRRKESLTRARLAHEGGPQFGDAGRLGPAVVDVDIERADWEAALDCSAQQQFAEAEINVQAGVGGGDARPG